MVEVTLEQWDAHHDNGWSAHVAQQVDGTFVAWAALDGAAPTQDVVEMDAPCAKDAALFALRRKSGHTTCSAACSSWQLHTHNIDIAEPTE